jgi:rsbT co-antagonist protein RsbR
LQDGGQAAEIEQLKARVAALEAQLMERERSEAAARAEAATLRAILQQLPVGLIAADSTGKTLVLNAEAEKVHGDPNLNQSLDEILSRFGLFEADKTTAVSPENTPLARALRGETVRAEYFVRSQSIPEGMCFEGLAAPFATTDGTTTGATVMFLDCGQRKFLEEETAAQNAALTAAEAEKLEIIARLRTAVEQLSTPILELWEDVLALPVIGIVDSRRSAEMMERLLQEIVQKQSRFVIIDLTGVEVIDTSTADHFMKLVKAVGLIGARCVLTGIKPPVAQTLVDLDVSFGQLETLRNLRHGLRYCLRWLDNEGV